MNIAKYAIILSFFAYASIYAQTGIYFNPAPASLHNSDIIVETGSLRGAIYDDKGAPLAGANVFIKEIRLGCVSDLKGIYAISNIKAGTYILQISFIGYKTEIRTIKIEANRTLELDFTLKTEAFQIGGIEVVGTGGLLPDAPETKTVITSAEIEHYQASSLNDVLDLVPGVQKSGNPGLSQPSLVGLRGKAKDELGSSTGSFGTLVILDGAPVSNNANMQFVRMGGDEAGYLPPSSGVDLRTIPADNIENIEVIRGLAPLRYGDVASGIIHVETKAGLAPLRLKFKNNPDTKEGNISGGYSLLDGAINFNVNAAQSARNIRVEGDEYTRLTGQAIYSTSLFDGKVDNYSKILFQRVFDEAKPKDDLSHTNNYNRGYTVSLSDWGKIKPKDNVSALEYNVFATMRRENTMLSRLITEMIILPSGDTAASYYANVQTKGIEWTLGGRLEWSDLFYTGDFIHKITVGVDPQYNVNTGQGVAFDTLLSYYGVESGKRPYSFDQIPGQLLASVYMEDKLTGNFLFDFTLQLGFRYEMYRPYDFNISGFWGKGDIVKSHQGTYFNPRVNLMVFLSEKSQLRLSAGTSSKTPPMSFIYPYPFVYPWRDPELQKNIYFRNNTDNPDLKGVRDVLYEISYDRDILDFIGVSLTSYYKMRTNEPKQQLTPIFHVNNKNQAQFIYSYGVYYNFGKKETKGIELTIKTGRIKPLNMDFQIAGSYSHVKIPGTGMKYSSTVDAALGAEPNYTVPGVPFDTIIGIIYPNEDTWYDALQLNYYVKYTLAPLGLWITLRAEQLVIERAQTLDNYPINLDVVSEETKADYYYNRQIGKLPCKWLFNLSLSKSLFKGAEVSFYVNNLFDDPATYRYGAGNSSLRDTERNPALYYGIEFSMIMDSIL
ncbi:MAG TPA: TonB-dependent receptor [Ignavibacteriales bacterium]|nr:TonB-dependent receptor [Ignavibacteriales bacterium]